MNDLQDNSLLPPALTEPQGGDRNSQYEEYLKELQLFVDECQNLHGSDLYSKTFLAKMFKISRITVIRWHQYSIENIPEYGDIFTMQVPEAHCTDCDYKTVISELRIWQLRNKIVPCPRCQTPLLAENVKTVLKVRKNLSIPGKHAKVIRFLIAVAKFLTRTELKVNLDNENSKIKQAICRILQAD